MCCLLQVENNVALEHVRNLLTLSLENHCVAVLHAWLDMHEEGLRLLDNFLSAAVLTIAFVHPTSATTFLAGLHYLHLHEAHVHLLLDLPLAFTVGTCLLLTALGT